MDEKEKQYAYWLSSLPGIGNKTIGELLEVCGGTAQEVYRASEKQWEQVLRSRQLESIKQSVASCNVEQEYEKLVAQEITFVSREEETYPKRLRNIPDAPYSLFVKGRLPEENALSVAIIGARDCSEYGRFVATCLGKYLGEQGVQIISGMARGIDGISQEATLKAGGTSYGVLGCGVDICYPAQNRKLYDRLIAEGGVLSSFLPGTGPKAQHFPPRNRIVSGLADVIIVIEARNKSGTIITVDMALEQGKDVYVVPGRITDRLSDGCNHLIRQGAGVIVSPEEFFEEISHVWEERNPGLIAKGKSITEKAVGEKNKAKQTNRVPPDLREIYATLDFYPLSIEDILAKLPDSYTHIQVNTAMLRLCMEHLAEQLSPGFFCLKKEQNSILLSGNPL